MHRNTQTGPYSRENLRSISINTISAKDTGSLKQLTQQQKDAHEQVR